MRRRIHVPDAPWASFSDVLSGTLFVFILTTVWFAWQLSRREEEKRAEIAKLTGADEAAMDLVEALPGPLGEGAEQATGSLTACISAPEKEEPSPLLPFPTREEARISLYFSAENITWFEENEATLKDKHGEIKNHQARAIRRVRDCLESALEPLLQDYRVQVFLEGHTDTLKAGAPFATNWELSGARAAAVLNALLTSSRKLTAWQDDKRVQVLAVGMAESQPAWKRLCDQIADAQAGPLVGGTDLSLDQEICDVLRSQPTDTQVEEALQERQREWAARGVDCSSATIAQAGAPETSRAALFQLWANRCPAGLSSNDRRRGLLRRVDLRFALKPRLADPSSKEKGK